MTPARRCVFLFLLFGAESARSASFLTVLPRSAAAAIVQRDNAKSRILPSSRHHDKTPLRASAAPNTASAVSVERFEPRPAASAIDTILFPKSEWKVRDGAGHDAVGPIPRLVTVNDESLSRAYHEFPLESFRVLVERGVDVMLGMESGKKSDGVGERAGLDEATPWKETGCDETRKTLLDLGSGCGRLVLYAGLMMDGWDVHGIEIGDELHDVAVDLLGRGVDEGLFEKNEQMKKKSNASVHLHLGAVEEYGDLLKDADLIFAYSTVFKSEGFSEVLGAVVMAKEWSQMLAEKCPDGCVVITTDRVLAPEFGWVLVEKLEVENPSLLGSVGYIQTLKKQRH